METVRKHLYKPDGALPHLPPRLGCMYPPHPTTHTTTLTKGSNPLLEETEQVGGAGIRVHILWIFLRRSEKLKTRSCVIALKGRLQASCQADGQVLQRLLTEMRFIPLPPPPPAPL